MFGSINNCHNVKDFRNLAKKRLPSPIFHYIDGAADDEITYKRNTDAYEQCDLIPNVLSGVDKVDMSTSNGPKIRYAFVLCTNCSSTIVSS
jgi:L-lactate dehydrogenase (cytochrome)